MSGKSSSKAITIVGILAVFIILSGAILLVVSLINLFSSLQKEVFAAIVAATGTILVSVFSVIFTKYLERKRSIEQELRDKKIPMYESFVEFWFDILYKKKITGEAMTEKEMLDFYKEFTQKILVWGSDGVIKKWSQYRSKTVNIEHKGLDRELLFEFEELLLEIRKDTGHKNKSINKGDLLGLFINDIKEHL
ncbi:hypothetical protein M3194_20560 [Paenibacillus glycanilyticus]|uniref:hypothetical protein n=1 Tax=Paenibacillus glycanilyticus TaxID=126569 RepID=UPI00203BEEC6|nr:hypothetical protein [Paenibacillus glycanilyticus]MCM3629737.1 hypothetical protein [Paenibacillus glycanilyticus]